MCTATEAGLLGCLAGGSNENEDGGDAEAADREAVLPQEQRRRAAQPIVMQTRRWSGFFMKAILFSRDNVDHQLKVSRRFFRFC